jgi:hypothetical protein
MCHFPVIGGIELMQLHEFGKNGRNKEENQRDGKNQRKITIEKERRL